MIGNPHFSRLIRLLPALALAAVADVAWAQQQLTFGQGASANPAIADNGGRVAFQSTGDPADGDANPDGAAEIFVIESGGSGLIQVTDSEAAAEQPAVSGDGQRVVFISSADPGGDNGDGSPELFVAEVDGDGLTQITASDGDAGIQTPDISADGARVVFSATADLLGDGSNEDGGREVFAVDAGGGNLVQLTDGGAGTVSEAPRIAPGGGRVVYASDADPAGGNGDGNREIFVVDAAGGQPTQLTETEAGESRRPDIAGDGRVVFASSADPAGDNGDGSFEIFGTDTTGAAPEQLTDAEAGDSDFARIAADGGAVAFQSTADLAGNNADGSAEIFVIASDGGQPEQLTESEGASERPAIAGDGSRVVFQSTADLTGNNGDGGSQIYAADPAAIDTGGDDDNGDDEEETPFYCWGDGSGCSYCPGGDDSDNTDDADDGSGGDDSDSDGDSDSDSDSDGDDGSDSGMGDDDTDTEETTGSGVDPTLAVLAALALGGVGRRSGRRRRDRDH